MDNDDRQCQQEEPIIPSTPPPAVVESGIGEPIQETSFDDYITDDYPALEEERAQFIETYGLKTLLMFQWLYNPDLVWDT